MPRGFVWMTYSADNGDTFQTLVDADEALDTDRGWGAVVPGADPLPRGFRARRAYGISPTTGVTRSCRVGALVAPLWSGAAATFTVEANDGTVDTLTVVRLQSEHRPLSH